MALLNISFTSGHSSPQPLNGGDPTLSKSNWNGEIKECKFRDIPFPVESCELDFTQRQIMHQKPNVDGAKIESLGRNPIHFHIKALLINGLLRGKIDTWDNLFPETFNKLLLALFDGSAGDFIHPTLGLFTVKPMMGTTKTQATERNGQTVEFELVESNTEQTDSLISGDEISLVANAASSLDAFLQANPQLANTNQVSLSDSINNITRTIYSARSAILNVNQQINQAIYQVEAIGVAAKSLQSTQSAIALQNVNRVKSGLHAIQQQLSLQSNISFFKTLIPMTLGSVSNAIGASSDDLVRFNPDLLHRVLLPVGTTVAYPKS